MASPAAPVPAAGSRGQAQTSTGLYPLPASDVDARPERTAAPMLERQKARRADAALALEASAPIEEIVTTHSALDVPAADAGTGTGAMASAPPAARRVGAESITPEQVLARLEDRCGPAPGLADSRRLVASGQNWHLEVREHGETRSWHCTGNKWTVAPAL